MKIYNIENISEFNLTYKNRNAIIGFFDGVHIGHQELLKTSKIEGKINVIITFDIHLTKEHLIDTNQKIELLSKFGYDEIFVLSSNSSNLSCSYKEFNIYLKNLGITSISVGSDFKYGFKAKGNVNTLNEDFNVSILDLKTINNNKISSSKIRELVQKGDIKTANEYLGYNYTIRGEVIYGNQIGRTIDFPTANIRSMGLIPNNGIYMTRTKINGIIYQSLTNIGNRPTIDDNDNITIETYIIDYNDNLYGSIIDIEIIKFIRGEIKFNNLDELKAQIKNDIKYVKEYNGN